MELVSIVIPVYKVEKYLHRCLDSVKAQSYRDFQCILIDDGSPDNCGKICDEYSRQDTRFITLHIENGGVSNARNIGLRNAKGKYVTFVDSDDSVTPNYISALLDAIKYFEADCVTAGYVDICAARRKANSTIPKFISLDVLKEQLPFSSVVWSRLYRNDIIQDNDLNFPVKQAFGEDGVFLYRFLAKCNNIVYIPDLIYNYYHRSDSASTPWVHRNFEECLAYYQEILSFYQCHLNDVNMISLKNGLAAQFFEWLFYRLPGSNTRVELRQKLEMACEKLFFNASFEESADLFQLSSQKLFLHRYGKYLRNMDFEGLINHHRLYDVLSKISHMFG